MLQVRRMQKVVVGWKLCCHEWRGLLQTTLQAALQDQGTKLSMDFSHDG
jgi:hypothetical protein